MSNKKPMLLFFAGPNGSGKNTITQYFDLKGTYTNADEIVRSTGMDELEAAKYVDRMRYDLINKGEDLTFETVLSSPYKLQIIDKALEQGYFIKGIFVLTVDPRINVARVRSRVASGGHSVDEKKIKERYDKLLANIARLITMCDIFHVYDNTVAPTRIIRKHKEMITTFPNKLWTKDQIETLMR